MLFAMSRTVLPNVIMFFTIPRWYNKCGNVIYCVMAMLPNLVMFLCCVIAMLPNLVMFFCCVMAMLPNLVMFSTVSRTVVTKSGNALYYIKGGITQSGNVLCC